VNAGVKLLSEFKTFLLQGNLITVAIAFVMGVSFAALLTSFVSDMITPIIGAVVGQSDFSNLTFTIHSSEFKYGAFITAILTFVSIAAAVFFFIVKPYEVYAARTKLADDEPVSDEERRHQELLAAIRGLNS
jgi:large conductance mechanosensitive channel